MEDTIAEVWTDEKEEGLVEMWQERSCLYGTNSPDHCDRTKRLVVVAVLLSGLSPSGKLYVYRPKNNIELLQRS